MSDFLNVISTALGEKSQEQNGALLESSIYTGETTLYKEDGINE